MTNEEIVALHRLKTEMIADQYYSKFNNEVEEKTYENVWQFLRENEKNFSAAVTAETMEILHERGSADLLIVLRENGLKVALDLTKKIQSQIK